MRGLTKPTMRMSQLSKLSQNRALASISISAQWRCLHTSPSRKSIGASSSSSSKIVDIEAIRTEMLARPPQIHPDIMSPTNSSLLFNTLSDSIPAGKWQRERLTSGLKKEETGSAPPMLLPPGHHLVYFPLARPNSKLCPDGTDPYHTPHNTPFTRRMWAGGSISGFQRSRLFLDCRKALCHERIVDVNVRGSPGSEKIFVEVLREYVAEDEFDALYDSEAKMLRPRTEDSGVEEGSRLTERRTLVFMRELSDEDRKANLAQAQRVVKSSLKPASSITITPTPTLLFHYSALSYNAHRIHLDRSYCREVEGHKDLLVHGPLSLTIMLSVLQSQLELGNGNGTEGWEGEGAKGKAKEYIDRIDYRHLAPLYVGEEMRVCVAPQQGDGRQENESGGTVTRKWDVWVENQNGGLSVRGVALTKQIPA